MRAHLQLVTDPRARDLAPLVESASAAGVDSVQVRDRAAASGALLALAAEVGRAIRSASTRLVVNDRVDVALAVRAHGVQLPARGIPPIVARSLLEPWQLIGVSVHSVAEAVAAAAAGADHVVFGHVFPTASHAGEDARGLDELRAVVDAVRIPVLAIGGITAERCGPVLAAGASGVAVIGAIVDATDPEHATRALRDALDAHGDVARPFPERRD